MTREAYLLELLEQALPYVEDAAKRKLPNAFITATLMRGVIWRVEIPERETDK